MLIRYMNFLLISFHHSCHCPWECQQDYTVLPSVANEVSSFGEKIKSKKRSRVLWSVSSLRHNKIFEPELWAWGWGQCNFFSGWYSHFKMWLFTVQRAVAYGLLSLPILAQIHCLKNQETYYQGPSHYAMANTEPPLHEKEAGRRWKPHFLTVQI